MTAVISDLTEETFSTAIASGTTLVDFWAPWCMPCQMQGKILKQVAADAANKAVVTKVNVDEHPGLAEHFSIGGIPTLLLFKDGTLLQRFVGVQDAQTLVAAIEAVA